MECFFIGNSIKVSSVCRCNYHLKGDLFMFRINRDKVINNQCPFLKLDTEIAKHVSTIITEHPLFWTHHCSVCSFMWSWRITFCNKYRSVHLETIDRVAINSFSHQCTSWWHNGGHCWCSVCRRRLRLGPASSLIVASDVTTSSFIATFHVTSTLDRC